MFIFNFKYIKIYIGHKKDIFLKEKNIIKLMSDGNTALEIVKSLTENMEQ